MAPNDLIETSPTYVKGFIIELDRGNPFPKIMNNRETAMDLLLVTEGNGQFIIGEKKHKASPGTLLINQSGLLGKAEIDSTCRFKALYLRFSSLKLKGLPENHLIGVGETPVLNIGQGFTDYEQLILQLIFEWEGKLPEAGIFSEAYLSLLIGKLVRKLYHNRIETKKRSSSAEEAILVVKQLIEEKYQESWTLESLGERVFLSSSHLCRQFKRKVGWTPGQYLIRCRMEAAKKILTHSNATMGEIADQVGYKSETHFHQVFKKHTKITPGHYREIQRSQISNL
ncbi:helix-turn-helix transcriptional regulator [Planococcus halotolerans]|uniref:HTH araC/xylS-type domain-containing protein n=1 Tax=Planococcus halotolerans TaxID=2233542 RepID=A0A365L2M8_9BACL|nr:helix-turn-helix domain-containing protein [Planococcus halotolerans]QHJ70914.1 AraC family transcriptional regulator [Planococcus halotolerans]RAZ79329.1 hypothetical protein DP120_06880 [Planococcus halotolerans]